MVVTHQRLQLSGLRVSSATNAVSDSKHPSRLVRIEEVGAKRIDASQNSASHAEGRWLDPSRDHTISTLLTAYF
jgi:hypothetical protein